MQINNKQAITNLKGEAIKNGEADFTVGDALGNILISDETGGKLKLYSLALATVKQDTMQVDNADLALIKQAIQTTKAYNVLVTGQLLEMLENLKTEEKPKKNDKAKG